MTKLARGISAILLIGAAWPVHALELILPANAVETESRDSTLDQEAVPTGPFADGTLPVRIVEGPVTRRAYRIPSSGMTSFQILAPIRTQLETAGYEVLLDCETDRCGGFDFRFGIDVLPAPGMYVNIRGFHFISAALSGTDSAVTLLASAASGAGYLQIVQIGSDKATVNISNVAVTLEPQPPAAQSNVPRTTAPQTPGDLVTQLQTQGRAVLHDLDFAVGATTLSSTVNPELATLAELLQARRGLRIAVVGHTDTEGGLQANINISRARAQAVRSALINTFNAPAAQIDAEGMGYLAPIASNLTPDGRDANRRVEVIVLSDDG
ncbi:MAG: OmpA family protein [Tateyamaria sp.]|uniref:OmpA family protein n=2 Tax=Tateyamaria sp. TaxID=1929288 RepID=UPI00329CFA1E